MKEKKKKIEGFLCKKSEGNYSFYNDGVVLGVYATECVSSVDMQKGSAREEFEV